MSASKAPSVGRVPAIEGGKDHINSLGFRNDGYDYTKHLKEMGMHESCMLSIRSDATYE